MPIIRVDWSKGKSDEDKRILAEFITNTIHELDGVDKSRIVTIFNDHPVGDYACGGKFAQE